MTYAEDGQPVDPESPPPAHLLMPPGTVVTPPAMPPADDADPYAVHYEPAATGLAAAIPYEKQFRTPPAFQYLEGMMTDMLGIDAKWFVVLAGSVAEHGSVGVFGEVRELAGVDFRLYRIASFDSRNGRFTHASRIDRADADKLYAARIEELA